MTVGQEAVPTARLAITEAGGHLIDVSNPLTACPGLAPVAAGACGRGLWQATRLGTQLSRFLTAGERKTVRAHMVPGPVPA
jgi:hypothetical protein